MSTLQRYDCALVDLASVPYHEAWELQRRLVAARHADAIPDVVLLLEHPHTYTIGRRGSESEVLASPEHLASLDATVIEVDRGGLATYHGPGQLVGYPILDLRPRDRDVHRYLRDLEQALINTLQECDVPARRVAQKAGVWVNDRKIASIGVRFSRWISSHGFALNVTTDLSYFSHIVPCGMPTVTMTSVSQESSVAQESSVSQESSIARETGKADMALIRERIAHHLAQVFDLQYVEEFSPALAEHLATLDESQVMALR